MSNKNLIWWLTPYFLILFINGEVLTQQDYCNSFLKCEVFMMEAHQRCTRGSRNEVARSCGLTQDFDELTRLMRARVDEFSNCVQVESAAAHEDSLDVKEINASFEENFQQTRLVLKAGECPSNEPAYNDSPKSCWETVIRVKHRCRQLQHCCPVVKTCLKMGKNSPLTLALREKHSIINGRTLECRNRMRLLLQQPHKQSDPMATKARAVLIAQGEKIVENLIRDEELVSFNRIAQPLRLETTKIRMPLENKSKTKMHELVAELTRIIFNKTSHVNETTERKVKQPIQPVTSAALVKEDSNISNALTTLAPELSIITPNWTTTGFKVVTTQQPDKIKTLVAPKNLFNKHKSHGKQLKNTLQESETIRNIVTRRPHLSFALPQSVNLTKLNLFAARPQLLYSPAVSLRPRRKNVGFSRRKLTTIASVQSHTPPSSGIAEPSSSHESATYRLDSKAQNAVYSHALLPKENVDSSHDRSKEYRIDVDTRTKLDWHRRRHRIFAANKANLNTVHVHFINHLRHKQQQTTTASVEIVLTTGMPSNEAIRLATTTQASSNLNSEEDTRLIKVLRQLRRKAEDHYLKLRTKRPQISNDATNHTIPKSSTKPKRTQIFTSNGQPMKERTFIVDGSTEVVSSVPIKEVEPETPIVSNGMKVPVKHLDYPLKIKTLPKQFPPVDADTNRLLLGYRNKLMSIRRRGDANKSDELQFALGKDSGDYIQNNLNLTTQRFFNDTENLLERTTIAYTPSQILSVNLTDILVPINWKDIRRAPAKEVSPPPIIDQDKENGELAQVKADLIRNLQEYIEKHEFEMKHQEREHVLLEEKRLALLRRERSVYELLGLNTGYCELYSICADQLKFIQNHCQQQTSLEASNFFKRKFGSCNARLWALYQETDKIRLNLLEMFEDCLNEKIAVGEANTVLSCRKDWPTLPMFDDSLRCTEKTRLIHEHCISLGKCCESLNSCKVKAAKHELYQKLTDSKYKLSKSVKKCKFTATMRPQTSSTAKSAAEMKSEETIVPTQSSLRI